MDWKILSIKAPDGELITEARYFVSFQSDSHKVDTEGNWSFQEPVLEVPFAEVSEQMVIDWIKDQTMKDGINMIESRLKEQMESIKKERTVQVPWGPQIFTPNL